MFSQPFATADSLFYRNSLVVMRPLTKSHELPSAQQVIKYLHNQFALTLKATVAEIETVIGSIATCGDMWSLLNNKQPYFGAMSSYIVIEMQKKRPVWKLKTTIMGFRSVEGAHDGDNLGRYYFSMCRRIGIINVEKKVSKVCFCVSLMPHTHVNVWISLGHQPLIMLWTTQLCVKP